MKKKIREQNSSIKKLLKKKMRLHTLENINGKIRKKGDSRTVEAKRERERERKRDYRNEN